MGMRYKNEDENKENGVVYTAPRMAEYVADQMIKYSSLSANQECVTILDPAVGEGELLVALITRLLSMGKSVTATGYETNKAVAENTQKYLQACFPDVSIEIRCDDFLNAVDTGNIKKYDFVIANPPYVRTQIIGSKKAQEIAEKLKLTGRVDIYYAFLVYTKNVLKRNGVSGYITSNKFMTIRSGASVRNYMLQNYCVHQITDLGDTKLFSASVLPCIIIFSHGTTENADDVNFTSVYEENTQRNYHYVSDIFDVIHKTGVYRLENGRGYRLQQGKLKSTKNDDLWTLASQENREWLDIVESNTWMYFSNIGKIRVGIKTTADNVFIGDDWTGDKSDLELLCPLITHRNAGQIVGNNHPQWKVLYTHTMMNGKKVAHDIERYPKTKNYLLEHYDQLSQRSYVLKAKRNWYEIWVPQNPTAWQHRKIVFRDISAEPQFWLDESGAVVNGDCYWIDIKSELPEDIVYLALAVANSTFIEKFYDVMFNTKLYSGKRRYQTQYVEQFPIPRYDTNIAQEAISIVKKIIVGNTDGVSNYKKQLDLLVTQMFNQKN